MKRIFKKILIAVDPSGPAAQAARVGCLMAAEMNAEVLLLHVVNNPRVRIGAASESHAKLLISLRRKGRALVKKVRAANGQVVPARTAIREGAPAEEILAGATEWGAQLIVIGTSGQTILAHLLLGSTAEAVLRCAHCPVMTVGDKSNAQRPQVHQIA